MILLFTCCTCLYVSSPWPAGLVGKILDLYIYSSVFILVSAPVCACLVVFSIFISFSIPAMWRNK